MRFLLGTTLLAFACNCALAAESLPVTSSLGVAELPVKDVAEFVFMPSEVVAIRSSDSVVGIESEFALEDGGVWRQTFRVPDGKMMVITQFELSDTAKTQLYIEQMTDETQHIGWPLYSAYVSLDFQGVAKPLSLLTTPLVLAPGKIFRLHTNGLSVAARGYYLEESASP
jgi:hypothetical protein